jgi:GTPase SAR1 family protein
MYAIDDQRSLERLYDEAENAIKFIEPETFVWAVVGNKADLRPEIEEASAKALSNTIGAKLYFYTSAKSGLNVKESMTAIVRALHRSHTGGGKLQSQSLGDQQAIKLTVPNNKGKSPNITTLGSGSGQTKCCKE